MEIPEYALTATRTLITSRSTFLALVKLKFSSSLETKKLPVTVSLVHRGEKSTIQMQQRPLLFPPLSLSLSLTHPSFLGSIRGTTNRFTSG